MIALTLALARAWVRLYTRGLDAALRDARRAELACDLWEQREQQRADRRRAAGAAAEILGRVIRGAPSDLTWRMEHRAGDGTARRLRLAGAFARRLRWTVFPALVGLSYATATAGLGPAGIVTAPAQLAIGAGAAAILSGTALLWRGAAPVGAAWLVSLGALAPALLIARSAPLSILWALLAMRSAVGRSDAVRRSTAQVSTRAE